MGHTPGSLPESPLRVWGSQRPGRAALRADVETHTRAHTHTRTHPLRCPCPRAAGTDGRNLGGLRRQGLVMPSCEGRPPCAEARGGQAASWAAGRTDAGLSELLEAAALLAPRRHLLPLHSQRHSSPVPVWTRTRRLPLETTPAPS